METSNGPMQKTGAEILKQSCDNYPDTLQNHLQPPVLLSSYPEALDPETGTMTPHSRGLTPSELRSFKGFEGSHSGEIGEYEVYRAFYELSCKQLDHPFLLLHSYNLHSDDWKVKQKQLREELSNFPADTNMDIELDFVILVKYVGVVQIEVKTTAKRRVVVAKAEKQLGHGQLFFSSLMRAIERKSQGGSKKSSLPYIRTIVITNETDLSTNAQPKDGSHIFGNDFMINLSSHWHNLVEELLLLERTFQEDDFKRFSNFVVGLWVAVSTPDGMNFDRYKASTVAGLDVADERVDKQVISSSKSQLPLTDVVPIQPNDGVLQMMNVDLIFLTPEQKGLLDGCQRVFITGAVGTGKSIMTQIKIIQLAKMESLQKRRILFVGPSPFYLKSQNIFRANNLTTAIIKEFPVIQEGDTETIVAPPHPEVDVVIMLLDDFFKVSVDHLFQYDISSYDIFIDDVQKYAIPNSTSNEDQTVRYASYSDIAEFFDELCEMRMLTDYFLWCCIDIMQCLTVDVDDESEAWSLICSDDENLRPSSLPIYRLTHILRNTKEIIDLVKYARDEKIKQDKIPNLFLMGDARDGHRITCKPVTYHKLEEGVDENYKRKFALTILCNELEILLNMTPALPASHIAILQDDTRSRAVPELYIIGALERKFNRTTQCIEESLATPDSNALVLDNFYHCSSMEFPCVIYIGNSGITDAFFYILAARARSFLVIIDHNVRDSPITTPRVNLTTWGVDAEGSLERV